MATTKYFSKNTNGEFLFASQTEDNWTLFKADYESAHPNETLILLTGNVFPNGFNLVYDGIKYTTKDNTPLKVVDAKNSLIRQVSTNTNLLRFGTTVIYNGHQYLADQITTLYYGLLDAEKEELTTNNKYPIYISQLDVVGGFLVINNEIELEAFVHPILFAFVDKGKVSYDMIQVIKSLTTIESIINYTDNRL